MTYAATIGIDLGGTKIKGGVVDAGGGVLAFEAIDTEGAAGFEHVFERLLGLIECLPGLAKIERGKLDTIGIGVPGPMSRARGMIYEAPNLPGWTNVPLRDLLQEKTGARVIVENDANAAGFGEFVAGAGHEARDMVFVTLGTGVGGGVVLDGKLWAGAFDNAGEIGHAISVIGGRACKCGQFGCLEQYASATAIAERYVEARRQGDVERSASPREGDVEVDSKEVAARAARGDAVAARIWREACMYLAAACVNLQHVLNPRVIVLGGGLIEAGDALLRPVREEFARLTWKIAPDQPRIELATLGGRAGVIGAAMLARGKGEERSAESQERS